MTTLVWDQTQDRRYVAGVDRGVIYPLDKIGAGVVWNGLVSVTETLVGGEVSSHYQEGNKYLDFVGGRSYQATIVTFSTPDELVRWAGERIVIPGFRLTGQPRVPFDFTYRVGIDPYQIHLVYNALATPESVSRSTLGETVEPFPQTWKIDATPLPVPGFKPTAHFVMDSRRAPDYSRIALEALLYGAEDVDPQFPSVETLMALFEGV